MIWTPIVEMLTIAPERRAPHPGKHRLDHRHRTEELSFEQLADVGVVTFLDGRAVTVAGVVDENVDAAELLLGLGDRLGDLGAVGDVEGECQYGICVAFSEVGDLVGIASGDDRVVTCGNHGLG